MASRRTSQAVTWTFVDFFVFAMRTRPLTESQCERLNTGDSFSLACSQAASLYWTHGTVRKNYGRRYAGLSRALCAEKSLRESLHTQFENVQLVLRQRVACDGAVQESITREREVCDRRDERRGEFGHHT